MAKVAMFTCNDKNAFSETISIHWYYALEKRGPFAGINPSWQRITNGIKYRKSLGDFAVALSPPIEMIAVEKKILYFISMRKLKLFLEMFLEIDRK